MRPTLKTSRMSVYLCDTGMHNLERHLTCHFRKRATSVPAYFWGLFLQMWCEGLQQHKTRMNANASQLGMLTRLSKNPLGDSVHKWQRRTAMTG